MVMKKFLRNAQLLLSVGLLAMTSIVNSPKNEDFASEGKKLSSPKSGSGEPPKKNNNLSF